MLPPTYFACTLGQAAALNQSPKPYQTIGDFLFYQAGHNTHLPAIGFPIPSQTSSTWTSRILTFADIDRGTSVIAERLLEQCGSKFQISQTVALLCHSSPEFLFTWLALIRLGHAVLLIAPQCQPPAIIHLCQSCTVSTLLYDYSHSSRARESVSLAKGAGLVEFGAESIPILAHEDIF